MQKNRSPLFLAFLFTLTVGLSEANDDRVLRLETSTIGELDPYVIGEACVIYGRLIQGRGGSLSISGPIAFITGIDACLDLQDRLPDGTYKRQCTVKVPDGIFSKPERDPKVLKILDRLSPKVIAVYEVSATQVEELTCR